LMCPALLQAFRIDYKHALDGGFNPSMCYSDLGPASPTR
jgi:hypothetical protein